MYMSFLGKIVLKFTVLTLATPVHINMAVKAEDQAYGHGRKNRGILGWGAQLLVCLVLFIHTS